MTYFSDREFGQRPSTEEEIEEPVWEGLRALIVSKLEDGSFGVDFPDTCPDGTVPVGTDKGKFEAVLYAEIPTLPRNIFGHYRDGSPTTIDILDLLEFCLLHVAEPVEGSYHSFFRHSHLSFDRELGRQKFSEAVNRILSRNGLAYTLTGEGIIERLAPPVLREELISAHFQSGDATLDALLEDARRKFFSPRKETRGEALEKLWDAWERLKTTGEGSGKKEQINSLLDGAAGTISPQFRQHLEADAKELTDLGNNLQIRHFEVGKEMIYRSEHIDYLFHRLFNMVQIIIRTKGI